MPDSCPRDECPHPCHAAVAHHHRIHPAVKIPSQTATAKIPNATETTIMPTSIPCRHRSPFTITGSMSPPSCGLAEFNHVEEGMIDFNLDQSCKDKDRDRFHSLVDHVDRDECHSRVTPLG
mmetsp:Transcript_10549/g.19065  ORF Transcript_10549/g.19065 Transcript_10549/m.19065 type:complete len:121 (+) Transcript_10549:156-518(+)